MKNKIISHAESRRPQGLSISALLKRLRSRITTFRDDGIIYAGFTLIELLVVVLIIGILAAVALPQYEKAVWKARMAEVYVFTRAVEQKLEMNILENGYSTPPETWAELESELGINKTKYLEFEDIDCNVNMCWWVAYLYKELGKSPANRLLEMQGQFSSTKSSWYRSCYWEEKLGEYLCNSTHWDDISEGF